MKSLIHCNEIVSISKVTSLWSLSPLRQKKTAIMPKNMVDSPDIYEMSIYSICNSCQKKFYVSRMPIFLFRAQI